MIRELKEECSIDVNETDLEFFGDYEAQAINHPDQIMHMKAYMVKKWTGEIKKGAEVKELAWVNSQNITDYPVGTVLSKEQIPILVSQGLID